MFVLNNFNIRDSYDFEMLSIQKNEKIEKMLHVYYFNILTNKFCFSNN